MSRPSCYMPWYAVAISASGHIKPCCQWKDHLGSFSEKTIADAYKQEKFRDMRQSLLNNELPKTCSSCTEREEMVGTSRRFWFAEKFTYDNDTQLTVDTPPQLVQADVNFTNVCNLKCRMCGSWGSNQWFEEDRILAKKDPRFKKNYSSDIQTVRQIDDNKLNEIIQHTKTLQRIDFKGGEPMLAKNHVEFLENLYNAGGENIVLQYTTNGTVINDRIISALSKFRNVRIMFSVEGTGTLYQYIRGGPYTFNELEKTIAQYNELPNVQIGFNVTIQAYNLHNLKELYDKLQDFDSKYKNVSANSAFTTVCNSPMYLSPFVLPEPLRLRAVDQLKDISDFRTLSEQLINNHVHEKHWDTFVSFTRELDRLRNENVLDVIEDLRDYIDA